MASLAVSGARLRFSNILVVIKQTAFEEYSQLKLRGQAPKALRWKRLEQRYLAHKQCVTDLLSLLRDNDVPFSCVNRVELDRQHLADVDLVLAVGGDGTLLSAAHFLDHGTIPLAGINSDPNVRKEDLMVHKTVDERRSHGALCMCTAHSMHHQVLLMLYGGGHLQHRTRIRCKVKSTFSETRLVPALNDLLLANPSPAAVSRFRMGWLVQNDVEKKDETYGTISRFGGVTYRVQDSMNVWSSGMWVCTGTGSTAAMAAAGGQPMEVTNTELQYLIREHMMENTDDITKEKGTFGNQKLHLRWNSQTGRIFIDGSHLTQKLELGDEILIDNQAAPLQLYAMADEEEESTV